MYQPYVYRITNKLTGEFYHGSRTAKIMNTRNPEEDLWKHYFTHSAVIKAQRKQYGDDAFRAEVVQVYSDSDTAWWAEQHIIKQSIQSDFCLNKSYKDPSTKQQVFLRAGIPHTKERNAIVSAKLTGREKTQETKDKLSVAHTGRQKSPEHLANLANAVKGRKMPTPTQAARNNISTALKGKPWSQARKDAQNAKKKFTVINKVILENDAKAI